MAQVPKAFLEAEAHARMVATHQTFGHLFPDKPHYEGVVRFAMTLYGSNIEILHESETLPGGSPWWGAAITDFVDTYSDTMKSGDVFQVNITVEIVKFVGEIEDWVLEECADFGEDPPEPETWQEIHISEPAPDTRIILVRGDQ